MDKILNLLKRAQDEGVRLELEGGNLVLKSENENINDTLLSDVKNNKDLIIKHLEKFEVNRNNNKGLGKHTVKPFDRSLLKQIPLSYSQERLWFLDQLGGNGEYNMPLVLRLGGVLNISILEESLQTIVSRHEVLRTNLLSEDGIGYQEVVEAGDWFLEQEAVSDEEMLEKHLHKYLNTPFNLSNDYKLRACLYILGDEKYVLACVFHHIASDGWSGGILVNEFVELYSALKSNSTPDLPELHLQYADYAIWQRNYLEGEVLDNQLSYWEAKLSNVSTLSLPTDHVRPSVQSSAGGSISLELDKKISTSLSSICQEEGVTLFMLLLSAFKILLSRYSGQDDICVGTPIANRTQSDLEGMIGFFVNTLALRSDLSGDPSFKDLLSRVKQTTLEGYDHQLTPFEKVVDRVVTSRDMSMSPLFQVMFVLQNEVDSQGEKDRGLHDIIISEYEFDTVTSKFDLTLGVAENSNGILLTVNYCTALFDKITIDRMLLHYQELLKNIIRDINKPIGKLSILPQEEEHQLLNVFNATSIDYPKDKTIVDLFSEQVSERPKATAVIFNNQELTYEDLDVKSNQFARFLINKGVGKEDLIGICINRSFEMLIGILGILKSGGAYVPIDPEYPADRIAYMLEDSGVKFLLSDSKSLVAFPDKANLDIILLDRDWDVIARESTESIHRISAGENLAYIIYTSGSTGQPKGVEISNRSLASRLQFYKLYYAMTAEDKVLFYRSFSFDGAIEEYLMPFTIGGCCVMASVNFKDDLFQNIIDTIQKYEITKVNMPPLLLQNILDYISDTDLKKLQSLRHVVSGGDKINTKVVNTFNSRLGSRYLIALYNSYGPTENTIDSTIYRFANDVEYTIIPIGGPVGNSEVYILDEADSLVAIGLLGEICVSGDGIARGYLNKPLQTIEKFIEHPFKSGEKLYKTGDIGRWLPDGTVEFMGRKDDQVKISGHRIELGEIEYALLKLEEVRKAVVLVKADQNSNKRLVAFLELTEEINTGNLRTQLSKVLPKFMIPNQFIQLEAIPFTSNGKVDKNALPDPDGSELSSKEYVAPRNETETQLAEIWQNLLGVEQVGIYDNFFELGGHSLLATRLVSMIRKDLKREVSIREVFEHTTISELGTHLSSQSEGVLLPVITGGERPERIPLSFSQERLWFLDQLQGSTEYHIPIVLSLEGALEMSLLEQTLHGIVSRHEILRSMLLSEEGIAYQQIISAEGWSLDTEIISDEFVLKNQIADYVNQSFDLSKDYKLRACLYTLGNQKYVLVCVFHHIASDGWSEGILVNEFTQLYSALQSNSTPNLPTLHLQYADYAIWQRNYLEGAVLEDQLSYWESKLSGVSTLSLPTDYPRPSVPSNAGAAVSLVLDQKLSASLNTICKEEGVTLFMLLLSAFKILLSRYSGQEDICVGTPIANRTQAELEGMIGFFVNTLALRSDLSGDPSFKDVLSRVKQTTLEGYDHQLTPFEKVVDRVVTSRDRSMSPLFQVMFVLQNEGDNQVPKENELNDIIISGYEFDTVSSKFDLTFSASENNNGISLVLNYCTALFDKATIESMLLHYQELLQSIVSSTKQPISTLSMLSQAEEHQLLNVFNNTEAAYPSDKTIVDLFTEQVKQTPTAIAVVYEDEKLTYKELDERSNQLAHYLREQGVKPDTLVGICLERSLEMLIGILGILKSGGAYVPIDPEYPTDRIAYMLKDAGIDLVLSSQTSCNVINRGEDISVLCLDKDWDLISGYPTVELSTVLTASNLAYVIYTSGSTGTPKGVLITHKNVVRLFKNESPLYDFGSGDVWTLFHSFCFDFSVWEMYGALLHGGRLVVVPKALTKDAVSFKELLIKEGVTVLNQTPGSFYVLQEEFLSKSSSHSLRYVIFGGEALNSTYLERWKRSYADCKLINMYGITETTVHVTYKEITETDTQSLISNIGTAIPTLGCYIVDAHLNLVPIGVEGELCISGAGVARGYLNREDLTNEKFIANPFSADKTSRLYRSGDLARWLPDGNIEYIGRKDDQVKIRGYRIELGEIENALSSLAGVNQCCVLAKEDTAGNKRLVGYVVLEGALDKEQLQNQLKLSLPEYMIPQLWVALDTMPLTGNGKLDKKALPDPDGSGLSSKEYVAPRNDTETQLAGIWQNLLGVERAGIHDDFFELGGHSLLATRLVSMIRKELSKEIEIADVFAYTTISDLETHLSSQSEGILLPVITGGERPERIPLSFSQERLWFLDQLQGSTEYHIPIVLSLEGALEMSLLEQTLHGIVSRHEILRSMLLSEEGIAYQQIISAEGWSLDTEIISDEFVLKNQIADYAHKPFDLSKDYKLRACLYTLGNQKYVLVCVFHHIASDGWSEGILVNEFTQLYSALQSNSIPNLPTLHLQYADYAIWQRNYLEGAVLEDQLSYWESKLSGVSTLSLPTDYPRPSVPSNAGAAVSLALDQKLKTSLNAICKEEGVTLFMLLLSAFKILLSRYSGQEDICVGTPIANRTQAELEGMIGFFVNTLALRSDLSGDPSFKDVLSRVKQTTLEGYDHQLTPFEKVVDRVVTSRDRSMSPLFQVMFVLQNEGDNQVQKENKLNNIIISEYEFDTVSSKFDLTFSASENNNGISLAVNYCTALFDKATIESMLLHYQELLQSIVSSTKQPISTLSMLSQAEEHQLLNVFNNTEAAYPSDKTIVDLFTEQVKQTPTAIAVVYEDAKLTYKELDERSNQLAHYLREQGVKPDTLVGICLERSLEMLIGILGILKSGGAYVPIDPEYPTDRIAYMLKDAGIDLVLSSQTSCNVINRGEDISVLCLDKDWELISGYPTVELRTVLTASNLAYVIYTSGSTGTPKGVMNQHSGIVNRLLWGQSHYQLKSDDAILQKTSFSFDVSVWEFLWAISCGARLVFAKPEGHKDVEYLKHIIEKENITTIHFVPSMLRVFLEDINLGDCKSLKQVLCSGEALQVDQVLLFKEKFRNVRLDNLYGPTEAAIEVSSWEVPLKDVLSQVLIGKPVANTSLYVLDHQNQLVPIGVIGELCIGGVQVARGYLNKEELTKEKFIANPFKEGERIYKTGDLARWLPDGNIECIGRKDDQVKIRGYRIELGEIENALSSLVGVNQCCVLAKEDTAGNKRLVGYVVLEGALDKERLQNQLKLSLPEYMVPQLWVALDTMPLSGSGKLDKKSLPNPDFSGLSSKEFVAPRNETEIQLAAIWQNLLGVEQIGIYDNFFELGGHSLLATRLVSMIRKALMIEVSIREVFEHATISDLGTHIAAQSEVVLLPGIVAEERPARIPLSFSQERLWFLDQLQGSTEYHVPIVLRLEGALDVSILEQTLHCIVSRHEVLRSMLLSEEGIGYQQIISAEGWSLDQLAISDVTLLENSLDRYLAQPFNLSKDYKLRSCLYDLGNEQYVLACVLHHIASDGWSEGILVNEFIELYNAMTQGRNPNLPTLPIQYADYAIWQRKYISGEVLETQLSYWDDQLQGVLPLLLPTDYVRPSIQSRSGASMSFHINQEEKVALDSICRSEGVTMFMLLLSAFKVLLYKYSGQEDICVGTPIANRTQAELEGVIGFFINNLTIRTRIDSQSSFKDLLVQVKETTLSAYNNQSAPFEKIVDRVMTTRDTSMSPLFQVKFLLDNTPRSTEAFLDQITIDSYERDHISSILDISFNAVETEKEILFNIEYCTDLFKSDTIQSMIIHFEEIISSIIKNLNEPINKLEMLSIEEKHQILYEFNNTQVAYPKDKTLVDLFEEQVKRTPNNIAVAFENEVLTYKELNEQSDCLAYYLKNTGQLESEDIVGVMIDRNIWSIVSMLGIMKSGACYLPIDKDYPDTRKSFIIEDANVKLLIIDSESLFEVMDYNTKIFSIDIEFEKISKEVTEVDSKTSNVKSSDLAYVIYTSGSTGNPKGVMIEHGSIVNTIVSQIKTFSVTEVDSCLQFASHSFDASISEIFISLLSGSQLYIIEEGNKLDVSYFVDYVAKNQISIATLPPAFLTLLDCNQISGIKTLITAGEQAPLKQAKLFAKTGKYINAYGPTEASICATIFSGDMGTTVPIGTPIANTQIYILDDSQNTVPIGVIGELCISGAGIARGYLNRDDLTREKFIRNPFIEGERLYKTGDLAQWLPDGNIEYIGRKDDQVKIRGYRIELGEIENVLFSLAGITQCCVLAREGANDSKRLVGYVVSEDDFDKQSIQESLKSKLPDYMVPQLWVVLDSFPLTTNGKVDKKVLPDPDSSDLSGKEYIAPRNETEAQLAEIWQNLLDVERVGVYDNFFELGGHSLLAIRMISMIRKVFEVEMSIYEVFEYQSIFEISVLLLSRDKQLLLPTIVAQERGVRIPLSFSQERLWFLDQLQGSTEYHIPIVLSLEGALEMSLLEQTLHGIVSRHEVLRSMLLSEEGIAYQQIISAEGWSLDTEVVSDEFVLKNQIADYAHKPFDLSKDYKLRACLYTLGNQKYVLVCVFHHIASDGWSEGILVNEFTQLYSALQSNSIPNLPTLHLQYADYAIWQRNYLEGAVLEDQLSYWESKLSGVSTLSLPIDYPRPSVPSNAGAAVSLVLDQKLSASLNTICKEEGVTLFMLLLSAFKILLSRYSGQEDICVGTPIANRTQAELEGMIGFFVNTLALRSDLSGDPSFKDVLSRVKQTTLEGYDHQLTPFEKVVDRVVTSRDRSMSPLFQVMFVLQNEGDNQVQKENKLNNIIISEYEFDTVSSKFDLTFSASENNNGISLAVNYCTALFDKATIESMLLHYQELLQSIVSSTKQPISTLSMLSQAEEHQLLNVFNNTEAAYPSDKTIVDLFTEQVKQTPTAIAVVYEDAKLTYKELDERSNQLAHYLREQGVKPDTLVGICLERSLEMLIGILGILKSGGAYVPIDPEYPTDRIAYMLKDAGIDLVLSSQTSCNVINRGEDISVLCLDKDWDLISGYPTVELSTVLTASNLAYVIYTSGSTGTPKGVMNEHSGIVNRLLWTQSHYQLKSDDAILQKTSFSFDVSVWEFLWAISCGARLVFAKPEGHKDVEYLKHIIEKENITTIHFVPSMLRVFLEDINLGDCKSLKQVLCSGEALQVDQVLLFKEKFRNVRLDNLYGPTEAAIDVSSWEVPLEDVLSQVLIGKPVANTSLYVLDHQNQLVPIGVIGELCIGGAQVARGYLNKEELTKEKFIANPFKEGERIYKTGDLARWLPDGNIEYIGRKDDQVKIRGYRIELGEIENALSSLVGVNQCCVLAKEDTAGNKRLVGYVVLEGALDKERLQNQLKLSLPEYMVPQLWVTLEKMPLTSNGKLDKKVLPDPDGSDLSSTEYVAPRNETEEQLAAIWQNLLGVEQIGIYDNFFELGGHSLLATRLVSMIRKALMIEVSIREVFEHATIVELASLIEFFEQDFNEDHEDSENYNVTIEI